MRGADFVAKSSERASELLAPTTTTPTTTSRLRLQALRRQITSPEEEAAAPAKARTMRRKHLAAGKVEIFAEQQAASRIVSALSLSLSAPSQGSLRFNAAPTQEVRPPASLAGWLAIKRGASSSRLWQPHKRVLCCSKLETFSLALLRSSVCVCLRV